MPFNAPVEMRARRATAGPDFADHLALRDFLTDVHVHSAQMQEGAGQALAVIDEDQTAFIIHVAIGKGTQAGGRRVDVCPFARGNIEAVMRTPGLAVEDAL